MSFWKATISRATALVLVSSVMGLLHNYLFSYEGIRVRQNPLQAVSGLAEARFIELEEAEAKWDEGVLFIDARAEEFFIYEGHIQGAISLPYIHFDEAFPRIQSRLPSKKQEVVCYCSGFGCEESVELAKLLMGEGYSRVLVYEGGWPEWLEAGLPVTLPEES
jgi:rhodanese-related sulfurtransferase